MAEERQATFFDGDVDNDLDVDSDDLALIQAALPISTTAAVPEPSAGLLMITAALFAQCTIRNSRGHIRALGGSKRPLP